MSPEHNAPLEWFETHLETLLYIRYSFNHLQKKRMFETLAELSTERPNRCLSAAEDESTSP